MCKPANKYLAQFSIFYQLYNNWKIDVKTTKKIAPNAEYEKILGWPIL